MRNSLHHILQRLITRGSHRGVRLTFRFAHDTGGAFALIFALLLIPIMLIVGLAVDFNRAFIVQQRLERALDAAALAVGATPAEEEDAMLEMAQTFFDANYNDSEIGTPGAVTMAPPDEDGSVNLSVSAEVDTTILSAVGIDTLDVSADTLARRAVRGLEFVLVLDNTGSMSGGNKMASLRTAASDLVTILFGDQDEPDQLKIGLVPFVGTVNIKADSLDMAWMDEEGDAEYHGQNFDPATGTTNHFDLFDQIGNAEWKGCVEMRPEPLDTLDTPPTAGDPDTLFVPFFAPDEPDISSGLGFGNNYLPDGIGGTGNNNRKKRQRNAAKYNGAIIAVSGSTRGPNRGCPQALLPLTNDKDLLLSEIDAMEPWNGGGTNIPHGLAWGWRVLSPEPPFTEGASYDDTDVEKALVLLTDGRNQGISRLGHNKSDYAGYGYLAQQRLGVNNITQLRNALDAKVIELCERVKDSGIRLYTVTFQTNSSSLEDMFRDCASAPELYFDAPSSDELKQSFNAIAFDLSNLRISQ